MGKDPDYQTATSVQKVIFNAGSKAVPYLMLALDSDSVSTRESAANLLGSIGKDAFLALPDLEEMRDNDPNPNCRMIAKMAYDRI